MIRLARISVALGLIGLAAIFVGGNALAGKSKATTKVFSAEGSFPIPEEGGGFPADMARIKVPLKGKIQDVDVRVRGAAESIGSVILTVLPPNGPDITVFDITAVNVANNIGTGPPGCGPGTVKLNDEASASIDAEDGDASGSYKPSEALSKLDGKSPTGNWRLAVSKQNFTDGGALSCFQLKVKTN